MFSWILLLPLHRTPASINRPVELLFIAIEVVGQYPVHDIKSITYTEARENLANTMNRVCEDNAPVIITRNRDQAVVMLSLAEYESLEETAHLLRSPENAKRLLRSIDQLERGKGVRKKLKLNT